MKGFYSAQFEWGPDAFSKRVNHHEYRQKLRDHVISPLPVEWLLIPSNRLAIRPAAD